ncbi:MAG: SAM-dependent chlorinase/fluorinase [Dehalococcoidia bacterium]|nr:SAM-dependent chlorinase/fluorinase [Dehalococcoidia bacterium]
MSRVITLTTDFGTGDGYVASMKGVILGINPQATVVDISHSVEPQSIRQASFILHTSWRYFPEGSIHVVVVDPGVGSHRKAVILKTPSACFITPDNGALSYVLHEIAETQAQHSLVKINQTIIRTLPSECEAVSITRKEYWRHPVSTTFHGRDIFAPVAAHLSLDLPITEFGESINNLTVFPIPTPFQDATGQMVGHIIHIDRFGNLITNLRSSHIPRGGAAIEVRNQRIDNTSRYYSQGSGLIALIGGNDYLELSYRDGSAASILGAQVGDTIKLVNPSA